MQLTYNQERKLGKAASCVGWLDLPTELLIEILKYLDARDILQCQAVCRTLRDLVAHCVELQYIIELAADNLIDGSHKSGSPSSAERLKLLLDRRRRWRELDWTERHVVPIPGQCQAYEFVGGAFAKSMGSDSPVGSKHLNVTWLPTRDGSARSVVRENLGILTRDFAIDPSQDMMALVQQTQPNLNGNGPYEVKVHIRSIIKNEKHPLAAKECLIAHTPFEVGTCFIQIVNDVVGMFFWLGAPGLFVWNWRTGELLVSKQQHDLPAGAWDFAFLSDRAYMVTSVYAGGSIHLYTFDSDGHDVTPPQHALTLRLPELQLGRTVHSFATHSSPFLGGNTTDDVPFTASQDDRIHVMSVIYGREPVQRFHLFVKNSFLLSLIAGPPATQAFVLPWDTWGPAQTRLLEHMRDVQFQWLRYVHGQRVVMPPMRVQRDSEDMMLSILDFNVHPNRLNDPSRHIAKDATSGSHDYVYDVVAKPSMVDKKMLFTHDVETALPYAVSQRICPRNYTGFMIDDQRIIGMKESAFADAGNFKDIDVFTF